MEIINDQNKVWELLETKINHVKKWPTLTQNSEPELKKKLWPYAVRAFFGACIRAHKRDLDQMKDKEADHGA